MENFRKLGLSESSVETLRSLGFEEPTEIQEKTIPVLLQTNKDVIAQAQTGTGKTAVFGLTFIEKLDCKANRIQAIVLTPTRELAIQVAEEINKLKGKSGLKVVAIYGGQSIYLQLKQLKSGADVIVGTPGRVLDHLRQKTIKIDQVKYAVLDEADEMLNMGFIDDIDEILSKTGDNRQLLLFSATMPDKIVSLSKKYMKDSVRIEAKKTQLTTNLVDQIYFEVRQQDKFDALARIIDIENEFYGIIFCRTKIEADQIAVQLKMRGYNAEALHGDIVQKQRETILNSFKARKTSILVSTDVAARGIDVNNLSHVINFSLPQDPESYVHRIGRTGRAGNEGTAITFITPDEYRRLLFFKKITNTNIRRESVPDAEEVISIKKDRLASEIKRIITEESLETYEEIAEAVAGEFDKTKIIAALLKNFMADELDIKKYTDIKRIEQKSIKVDAGSGSHTRLFITVGRRDNMSPKQLVTYIEKNTGVDGRDINGVEIFDQFSFVSVSFENAELILSRFKDKMKGRSIVVERASEGPKKRRKKY